jgi:hypothetical protein
LSSTRQKQKPLHSHTVGAWGLSSAFTRQRHPVATNPYIGKLHQFSPDFQLFFITIIAFETLSLIHKKIRGVEGQNPSFVASPR